MDPLIGGTLLKIGGSLLGGLLGRKKSPTPAQNIVSQAEGARLAAQKYGFNPLTMLQYGQPGGAMGAGGGGAPLASFDLLAGGLEDIADVVSGKAAQDRALRQAEIDLRNIEIEQMRSGVAAGPVGRPEAVAAGLPEFGQPPVTVPTYAGKNVAGLNMADELPPIQVMPHDPDLLTAQSAEDLYGEIGGGLQGLWNLGVVGMRNSLDPMREAPKVRPQKRPHRLQRGPNGEWLDADGLGYVLPPVGSSY